jgi:hypothetical protein
MKPISCILPGITYSKIIPLSKTLSSVVIFKNNSYSFVLIFIAFLRLPDSKRDSKIKVVSSETGVETSLVEEAVVYYSGDFKR